MEIYEKFLKLLDEAIKQAGNANQLAAKLGVNPNLITRWKNRQRVPTITSLQPLMDMLGVKLLDIKGEPDKDVCFVNARISDSGSHLEKPQSIDYTAAPLVGEVGAGQGYLPQEEIKSWFLVYRHLPAVRARKNLIAVQLGKSSDSMMPTLKPEDIVLVDRDDKDVSRPGHMMLVKDPMDGSGMIKRVSVQEKDEDFTITYYSDNAAKWPPMMYSLRSDFHGEWDEAIVGRVIWAWQDMRDK